MKKHLSVIIVIITTALSLSVNSAAAELQNTAGFKDTVGHWAEEQIKEAAGKGHINGYPDGNFHPDGRVSVDEFIKMIIMSLTTQLPDGKIIWSWEFFDKLNYTWQSVLVESTEHFDLNNIPTTKYWADPYLDQAQRMQFFFRYDTAWEDKYNVPLTREKAAYLIMSLIGKWEHPENDAFAKLAWESITDETEIHYKTHVQAAILKGIMRGYPDNIFKPNGYITRAEAVTIVSRILKDLNRDPYMPDLKNRYSITGPGWDHHSKIYVFPDRQYLNFIDALNQAKDRVPGHLEDTGVKFEYYESKEMYDKWVYEILRGNFQAESGFVIRFGLGASDLGYSLVLNTAYDLMDYKEMYNAFSSVLFEGEAHEFKTQFEAKIREEKETGKVTPISLVINHREVRITGTSNGGVAVEITE